MRFISPLSPSEALAVQKQLTSRLSPKERKRFTAILLSSRQHVSITELSIICCVSLNTIKSWFNRYDLGGFSALLDPNMSHTKSTLSSFCESTILSCVEASPQNLSQVVASLEINHQIKTNPSILRRYLKKKI